MPNLASVKTKDFNPPTPWGVGQRRTACVKDTHIISIHPLRGEWDVGNARHDKKSRHFNPPTPWGVGRPPAITVSNLPISIHPLRGEWDRR